MTMKQQNKTMDFARSKHNILVSAHDTRQQSYKRVDQRS